MRKSVEERFWEQVDKQGPDDCWMWTGRLFDAGRVDAQNYGVLSDHGKSHFAHRVSYMLHNNVSLSKGTQVCHTCDVSTCVNPKHLFLGTNKTNQRDRRAKGRNGSEHRKLSAADVMNILRERTNTRHSSTSIARSYGISPQLVRYISAGLRWRAVYEEFHGVIRIGGYDVAIAIGEVPIAKPAQAVGNRA